MGRDSHLCTGLCSIAAKDEPALPVHAAPGAEAAKLDDSAHMDMEKGGVPAGKGSSARGSAEFLQEVEASRSIKVRVLPSCSGHPH